MNVDMISSIVFRFEAAAAVVQRYADKPC